MSAMDAMDAIPGPYLAVLGEDWRIELCQGNSKRRFSKNNTEQLYENRSVGTPLSFIVIKKNAVHGVQGVQANKRTG
jgi:hypothetical protein